MAVVGEIAAHSLLIEFSQAGSNRAHFACANHTVIDFGERDLAKAYFDCVGHYSRPDLLSLRIHDEAWTPTGPKKL